MPHAIFSLLAGLAFLIGAGGWYHFRLMEYGFRVSLLKDADITSLSSPAQMLSGGTFGSAKLQKYLSAIVAFVAAPISIWQGYLAVIS